jgi:DNA/RNA-binding protein KIN17
MNSTRWVSLTEFVKYLGREGIVRAEENEKGWWISWVDNSPKSLARQAESQKRERADMDDEQRQRKQLKEQIERAQMQAEALRAQEEAKVQGLQRDEGAPKVSLSISLGGKKSPDAEAHSPPVTEMKPSEDVSAKPEAKPETQVEQSTTPSAEADRTPEPASATPPAAKVSIGNPLKRPAPGLNVFKQASRSAKTSSSASASRYSGADGDADDGPSKASMSHLAGKKFLTAAEKLMLEDMERKKRAGSGGGSSRGIGYQGMGPSRGVARR